MKATHKSRIAVAMMLATLLAIAVIWIASGKNDILNHGSKHRILSKSNALPYQWVSDTNLLVVYRSSDRWHCVLHNIQTGVEKPIPNLERLMNSFGRRWFLHAFSSWVMLDAVSDTNAISYLAEIDRAVIFTNNLHCGPVDDVYFQPNVLEWLRINGRSARVELPGDARGFPVNGRFQPVFSVGFITNDIFICATNDLRVGGNNYYYPDKLSLEYWRLRPNIELVESRKVEFYGDQIVKALVSPRGNRILWICYHRRLLPRISLSLRAPIVQVERRYVLRFYVSSPSVDDVRWLGDIPSIDNFPYIQWLPSGELISIDYGKWIHLISIK